MIHMLVEAIAFITIALPALILFFLVFMVMPLTSIIALQISLGLGIMYLIFKWIIKPMSKYIVRGDNYE